MLQERRPARMLRMDEVARVLGKTRRTIERWIVDGAFPEPIKIGDNSISFPLDMLLNWARQKHPSLVSEFERLAHTPTEDLLPPALEKLIAKEMGRQTGQRFAREDAFFGVVKPLSKEESARVGTAHGLAMWHAISEHMAEFTAEESVAMCMGSSRPCVRCWRSRQPKREGLTSGRA